MSKGREREVGVLKLKLFRHLQRHLDPQTKKSLQGAGIQTISETLGVVSEWILDNASFHVRIQLEDPYDGDIVNNFMSDLKKL